MALVHGVFQKRITIQGFLPTQGNIVFPHITVTEEFSHWIVVVCFITSNNTHFKILQKWPIVVLGKLLNFCKMSISRDEPITVCVCVCVCVCVHARACERERERPGHLLSLLISTLKRGNMFLQTVSSTSPLHTVSSPKNRMNINTEPMWWPLSLTTRTVHSYSWL
jgi:hypothetical protein